MFQFLLPVVKDLHDVLQPIKTLIRNQEISSSTSGYQVKLKILIPVIKLLLLFYSDSYNRHDHVEY